MAKSNLGLQAPASWVWGALFLVLVPTVASAQEEPSEFGDSELSDPEAGDTNNPDAALADDSGMTESLPTETVSTDQWFVGVQWRQLIIPAFVQQIFLDEAPTVFQPTFQVVATKRNSENFSLVFGLGYSSYAFDGLYRATGDPIEDTEMLDSNLGLLHGTFSALWASNINEYLDFEYGLCGELGVVLGELRRTEAYKRGNSWAACGGPFNPADVVQPGDRLSSTDPAGVPYCNGPSVAYDEDGEHYNVVEERIPPLWLAPTLFQMGLRITPAPQVAIKLEGAYGLYAFWFGASVHLNLSQL